MPESPLRLSKVGEADAEVILLDGNKYLFSTDDFSAEDQFRETDPYSLGWNIACGAISDIVAAGGKPLTYSQAMAVSPTWNEDFIDKFSEGISRVLQKYGISFIGGDLGVSDNWHYTASVIGKPGSKIIDRKGCAIGDKIFITGKIGAGNLEAALKMCSENSKLELLLKSVKTRFHTQEDISEILCEYATAAIDTSDGVFAALQTLAEINNCGFMIDNLPYITKANMAAKLLNLPKLLLCLGECGEYEILFTCKQENIPQLQKVAMEKEIALFELGEISDKSNKILTEKDKQFDFSDYNVSARDFTDLKEYLSMMQCEIMKRENKDLGEL